MLLVLISKIELAGRLSSPAVCFGIELDPLYVDVIIRRYEAETGVAAILADIVETTEKVVARRCKRPERDLISLRAFARNRPQLTAHLATLGEARQEMRRITGPRFYTRR